ncbi:MAG TPA: hypothetical protein ENN43_06400 [bacterium]|nr:hypothetical protein [bacterium]
MENSVLFNEAKNFFQVFEPKGEIITTISVPGSVQLLGETCEFNKGGVLSALINKSAFILAQKRRDNDRSVQLYSRKYDEKIRLSLNERNAGEEGGWANHIASTLFMLESLSKKVAGMNILIDNQIPDLFDANSSEALEAGVAYIASRFSDWTMSGVEIATACAEGERNFMGRKKSPVKYMPIISGKKGALHYFNPATNVDESPEADLNGLVFMTLSSGIKKKTLEAKRRAVFDDVERALAVINGEGASITSLDMLSMEEFDEYRPKLSMAQRKRCAFFISENERVYQAKKFIEDKNLDGFVGVINDSQKNIKNRLELVDEENEILIDIIQDSPEVKAVKMLNMGADGTVLLLVEKEKRQPVEVKIKKTFLTRTGLELNAMVFDLNNEMAESSINVSEFRK